MTLPTAIEIRMTRDYAAQLCADLQRRLDETPGPNPRALASVNAALRELERAGDSTTRLRAKVLVVRQAFDFWFGRETWLSNATDFAEARRALGADVESLAQECARSFEA